MRLVLREYTDVIQFGFCQRLQKQFYVRTEQESDEQPLPTRYTDALIAIHIIIRLRITIGPPLFSVTRETNSCAKDKGIVATIPTVINKDIPFPIPLSVIFSPTTSQK
jgi:hypothetical protein